MIYDNRNLTDGERIRLNLALETEDRNSIGRIRAGEFIPEPRRYPPEPALDVPRVSLEADSNSTALPSDFELIEDEFDRNNWREAAMSYRLSEEIRHTHRAQLQAARRALVKRCLWVAGWTVLMLAGVYAAFYVASWVANLILGAMS